MKLLSGTTATYAYDSRNRLTSAGGLQTGSILET